MTRLSAHFVATSFQAASLVTPCNEGFQCASRVARFGRGHFGEISPEKMPELRKKLKDPNTMDYEWGCPAREGDHLIWQDYMKESGEGEGFCREDRDCLCIARGSPEMHGVLQTGVEKQVGKFSVETARGSRTEIKKINLTVVPHYDMRLMPDMINPRNPHADIGVVDSSPRDLWLQKYKLEARKMQASLDELRDDIVAARNKVLSVRWLCGPKPVNATEEHPAFGPEEVDLLLSKIRRFQIFSRDCEDMQTTVPKLATTTDEQEFSHFSPWEENPALDTPHKLPEHVGDRLKAKESVKGRTLNCYDPPGAGEHPQQCRELNCYRDFLDEKLRSDIMWLKSKLKQCSPEHDIPNGLSHGSSLEAPFSLGREMPEAEHGEEHELHEMMLPSEAAFLAVAISEYRPHVHSRLARKEATGYDFL